MTGRGRKPRKPEKGDPIWEGYRRAKRSVRPQPLKVGTQVIYEDDGGRVHRYVFELFALRRDKLALIKGWPDGVVRRGPRKKLLVPRSALVPYDQVRRESFKAMFGVPEDTRRETYDVITEDDFLVALKQRSRRATKRSRRG